MVRQWTYGKEGGEDILLCTCSKPLVDSEGGVIDRTSCILSSPKTLSASYFQSIGRGNTY